jgi:hypothetical protein
MIFKLQTSSYFYSEEQEDYKELGFTFTPYETGFIMEGEPTITLSTLEELVEFEETWGHLVFKGDTIEIYDGYRE